MKKIVYVLTSFNYAGAESQVVQMAKGFRNKGWQVLIISMTAPQASLEELREFGIEFQHLGMRRGVPDPRAILKLKHRLSAFNPDIVHSHMVHANILARITRLIARMPVLIATAHNSNEGGWFRTLLYRLTDPLCNLTTNVSQDAVDRYVRIKAVPRSKVLMIPNGIDLEKFRRNGEAVPGIRSELGLENEFVWLAVGRMVHAKDYRNMVTAFYMAEKEQGNCKLLIAGDGILRESIEALSRTLRLEHKIIFLGIRNDILQLMSAADAFVMSSLWEGMPMVLLEASACELPMVVTDAGGNGEVVRDGISGYLVQPANPDHLAAKMKTMMALPGIARETMGAHGREHVLKNYSIENIIDRWEAVYSRSMNGMEIAHIPEEGLSGP